MTGHDCPVGRHCSACYQRNKRKLVAYGRWAPEQLLDATLTRNHLRVLSAAGIGFRRVASITGITASHVQKIGAGRTAAVHQATQDAILAIPVTTSGPYDLIDARGTQRRVQALYTVGWNPKALAPLFGIEAANVSRLLRAPRITRRLATQIADAYDEICTQPPTNNETSQRRQREIAAKRGWVPPLAWDDIDVDDAPATGEEVLVDEVAVQLVLEGSKVELSRAERHLAVQALHARGFNDTEMAQLLRVADRTILRDRQYLDLPANEGTYEERFAA